MGATVSDRVKPDGYNTPVPAKILTPDRVETRIGTLEFAEGFPTEATSELLYDHLDFLRGVEAFLNCVPAASLEAMRMGMEDVGVTACHQIGILDRLLDIKEQVADSLPPGSSGIVALFDEQWVTEVEKAMANADNVAKHEVDKDSAEAAKKAAAGAT